MPVTTASTEAEVPAASNALLHSGRLGLPAAFFQRLRMQTGGVAPRYRLVDFMDEACPLSSDGQTDVGSSDGEEEMMDEPSTSEQMPASFLGPCACSYLSVGQSFSGSQRLSNTSIRPEDWQMVVRIHGVDLAKGYVCGAMEASNVPNFRSAIVTFWEGEIIDNHNFTFYTQKWGASRSVDLVHWGKFPGFAALEGQVKAQGGRTSLLATTPHIFMRWKETFFVDSSDSCGLTIAGFYYVCLDRQTGSVTGYYFDPASAPFQYLSLTHVACPGGGMSFGSYAMR